MKVVESKLEAVEEEIAEIDAEDNFNKIKDNVNYLVDDTDNINCNKSHFYRDYSYHTVTKYI